MRLNIINGRSERTSTLLNEIKEQGITDFKLWNGKYEKTVIRSINLGHKQIIEDAYNNDIEEVCIAEDDFQGTHPNSWNYFIQNKPSVFDLYLSSTFLGIPDDENRVISFTGLTLYIVHKKFYPIFLSTPDDDHIDHLLAGLGDYHVCNPFTFIQRNGFSSNTGKMENYDIMFQNRKLYAG